MGCRDAELRSVTADDVACDVVCKLLASPEAVCSSVLDTSLFKSLLSKVNVPVVKLTSFFM